MKKRILKSVMALILGITMLTSCGSSGENTARHTSYGSSETDTISNSQIYVPGIYSSSLRLGNSNVELQITVDKDCIGSINLTNIDESITTLYPLLIPRLNELSTIIVSQQSLENVGYNDENRYTSMLLMQAISENLDKANYEGSDTKGSSKNKVKGKIGDLDFTVLGVDQQPDALKDIIAEKSKTPFQISYTIGEELYIAVGYGEQPSGGYSITVNAFYETADTLVIDTTLLNPSEAENVTSTPTTPYIVIKTENIADKPIEFK